MIANSQLLTTTPKMKTKANSANNQNRKGTTEMEITWRVINREVGGGEGGKGTENKQHKWQGENRGRVRIVKEMQKPKNLHV